MRRCWLLIAVVALSAQAPAPIIVPSEPSVGHMDKFGEVGDWQVIGGNQDNPSCVVQGLNSKLSLSLAAETKTPGAIGLLFDQFEGQRQGAHASTVVMAFDAGKTITLYGDTDGNRARFRLGAADLPAWLHEFTARSSMAVVLDGAEPVRMALAGTTPVVNAMGDCIKAFYIKGMPAPFPQPGPHLDARQAPAPEIATAPSAQPALPPPEASQRPQPGLLMDGDVLQTDGGCTVRMRLTNATTENLQHLYVEAEVFAGAASVVESFFWQFVDTGKERTTHTTIIGSACRPNMRVVIREVSMCKLGGEMFSDCGTLIREGQQRARHPDTAIPVEVKLQ